MDTQPRAEDEVLPQTDTQSEQTVAPEQADADVSVQLAGDGTVAPVEDAEVEADSRAEASEPVMEATEPLELSAEETPGMIEPAIFAEVFEAEQSPETTATEVEEPMAEVFTDEPETVVLSPEELSPGNADDATIEQTPAKGLEIAATGVTEEEFTQLVDDALEAVGGILLFKMRIDDDGEDKHVAAASIGDGARRQFLLLSLPVSGGKLKVESASRSTSPLAKLAEAYVGVVEAFRAAA
ncbi:hypothetical protein N7E70_023725 [Aminobacter sp. NyZ550]|uniref:hypothetical protein n=1 Tax=Aminobacter TaxID=31988 RepID=UPI0021D59D7C|nr:MULTISPECIES: hypothetical protein [Aminobacter]MCX8571064.1 hypothetical protein [Aminobacter sp. MET-1]MCX8573267.1 hypothetical protein [Aminobacter sp. MET-1]WAX94639.1 hypothetical protein N7E70_023725 [Aminobacter sp. NyZ550]CAI2935742.1 conserved protein of unknown function [Aminobacter niigataensis]